MTNFIFNDGGRAAAGFKGAAGDCVARSVAIASGKPYAEVYAALAAGMGAQRLSAKRRGIRELRAQLRGKAVRRPAASARNGVNTRRKWFKDYMAALGFRWVPTMGIGTGCKVHLRADQLPSGRLVVAVSKHYTTMIDGVINDTWNPDRSGNRCVYGYWLRTLGKGVPCSVRPRPVAPV